MALGVGDRLAHDVTALIGEGETGRVYSTTDMQIGGKQLLG